jgi:phosphoribosylaminoimidazole carboxylase PurE protein
MSQPRIAVVFGSDSDWSVMESAVRQLAEFGEPAHVEVMSAHRTPERVAEFSTASPGNGIHVIIAGAGISAALAGTIAAHTTVPVIGVPLESGSLLGIDALLATVQMPPGVPVAAVGIGGNGARNAALLAIRMLAVGDTALAAKYAAFMKKQADDVREKNRRLQEKLRG